MARAPTLEIQSLARASTMEIQSLARALTLENPSFAPRPRLENLPRIAFSKLKSLKICLRGVPPTIQPSQPTQLTQPSHPSQLSKPSPATSQLSKPSPAQLAQPGDYFVKMRNGWNLGASAALNPKRIWFGWTPAMSGRGWEKVKRNRCLDNRRDDALRKDTPRPKQF